MTSPGLACRVPALRASMDGAREVRWTAGRWGIVGFTATVYNSYRAETRRILSRLRSLRSEERRALGVGKVK